MGTNGLVLVVDDDPFMREITRIHLESAGFEVVLAESATDGMQKVRSLRPSVVVMDFAMPGGSGGDALRSIRDDEQIAGTPVLMVTAWASDDTRREATTLGAHWLQKPVMGDALVNAVRKLVSA